MRRSGRAVANAAAASSAAASSTSAATAGAAVARSPSGGGLPLTYERRQWAAHGAGTLVVGVDEAGRGPLAGPVVAAAVALLRPPHDDCPPIAGVRDSKLLVDEAEREALYEALVACDGLVWGVASLGHGVIDEINILRAAMRSMDDAVAALRGKLASNRTVDFVYIDGPRVPDGVEAAVLAGGIARGCEALIKGDSKAWSIAAASIIAKVTRDREMRRLAAVYPLYLFDVHKGYGTPSHMAAIYKHGPCPIHRRTFAPVKHMVAAEAAAASAAGAGASVAASPSAAPSGRVGKAGAAAAAAAVVATAAGPAGGNVDAPRDGSGKRTSRSGKASGTGDAFAAAAVAVPAERDSNKRRRRG